MRVSTSVALILAAVAGSQAAIDFPDLRQCDPTWSTTELTEGSTFCSDGSFATAVATIIRGAGFNTFGDASMLINPDHVARAIPKHIRSANTLTEEHISFLESLAPNFKYLGSREVKQFSQGVCDRAEGNESIVLLEIRDQDSTNNLFAVLSDCVADGANALRVMHPKTGYTVVELDNIVSAHEFSYDESHLTSYPGPADLTAAVMPKNYPHYRQCDPMWKDRYMHTKTVCAVGCLMSSVSMGISGHRNQFRVGGSLVSSNPGTYNAFNRANGGYTGNLFIHGSVSKVCPSGRTPGCSMNFAPDGMRQTNNLSRATFQSYIRAKKTVVANVKHGGHYVLAVGWDSANPDKVITRDPSSGAATVYSYTRDIVGWRIYNIYGPGTNVSAGEYESFDNADFEEELQSDSSVGTKFSVDYGLNAEEIEEAFEFAGF